MKPSFSILLFPAPPSVAGAGAVGVVMPCAPQQQRAPNKRTPKTVALPSQHATQGSLLYALLLPLLTCSASVINLLTELSSILEDSTDNMEASAGLTTATAKARWWKQRLALDARMAALLQQLDQEWLGPWRCLLMQPAHPQQEAAALAAAEQFVADYFDFVYGEKEQVTAIRNAWCC